MESGSAGSQVTATRRRELVVRRAGRADDRGAGGHRLEHRQTEALVLRGVDEAACAAVELGELVVGYAPEQADAGAADGDIAPAGVAGDAQLARPAPPAEALDQAG